MRARRGSLPLALGLAIALVVVGASACPQEVPGLVFSLVEEAFWLPPNRPAGPGPGEGRVLVTNNLDDTVSVLDLDALKNSDALVEVERVPIGISPVEREGPHHVTAAPDGEHYFIGLSNYVPGSGSGPHGAHGSGTADGRALKIRASDNEVVAMQRVDRSPGDIRLSPDGQQLYLTHFDLLRVSEARSQGIVAGPELDSRLAILDARTLDIVDMVDACPAAHGIAVAANGAFVALTCLSDEVAFVNVATSAHELQRVAVLEEPGTAAEPACAPYALSLSPDDETLWVSCIASGQVIAVDTDARALDGRAVQLPGVAAFGSFSSDGSTLAVAHQGADGVAFVDAESGAIVSLKLLAPRDCVLPHFARYLDDERVLVVCEGDKAQPGGLALIDAAPPHAVRATISLGRFADDVAILAVPP